MKLLLLRLLLALCTSGSFANSVFNLGDGQGSARQNRGAIVEMDRRSNKP